MRKLILSLAGLLAVGGLKAQAVADNAIIPVAVTLNSILRMNVTSGGNIEFVVNTIDQYTNGIANTARYTTTFTVASSQDFDVDMYAENANFVGSDLATNTFPVGNLGYKVAVTGNGQVGADKNYTLVDGFAGGQEMTTVEPLTSTETAIVTAVPTASGGMGAAGNIEQNKFEIRWELATPELQAESGLDPLLNQNLPSDRFATNVFLVLKAHQ